MADVAAGTPVDTESASLRRCRMRTDQASAVIEVDDACVEILGYSREQLIGKTSLQFVHADDHEPAIVSWIQMLEAPGKSKRSKLRYIRANGEVFWAQVTYYNELETNGWIDREIVEVDDDLGPDTDGIDKGRLLRGLFDVLPSAVGVVNIDRDVVLANDRWSEITGLDKTESLMTLLDHFVEPSSADLRDEIRTALGADDRYDGQATMVRSTDERTLRCHIAVRKLFDDDANLTGYIVCLDDITTSWRLQQRLVEQATRDPVTGLVNRSAALDHLDAVLTTADLEGTSTAVLFVDLDGFKRVNDVLGHAAGDQLLRDVGASFARSTRDHDIVARHGGDEFLVICENVNGRKETMQIAHRILNTINGRYRINGEFVDVGASCGISIAHGADRTAERMIAEADLAMYEHKRSRSPEPRVFQPEMFTEQRDELNLYTALGRAVDDDTLVLHYQPIVKLATAQPIGFEALLRWRFQGELVYPDQFISLAERQGLIREIGAWVLDEVCRQAAADESATSTWAVNVSPVQLRDPSFDETIAAAVSRHGIDPERLTLELTENVVIGDDQRTLGVLHKIAEIGVKLVVDDFGTGYASLDYLRNLPIHGIKIDRCFTADLDKPRTRTIISALANLAINLGIDLVVEGIETPEQAALAAATGAAKGQGYLFGRPQPLT